MTSPTHSTLSRWWTYQRERFPVISYSILVLAFSSATVIYPALLQQRSPSLKAIAVTFIVFFCTFLQLRIADEFKDYDHDCQYRPQRPVPRGLITLTELEQVEIMSWTLQLVLTSTTDLGLVPWLGLLWLFQLLMRREFFCRNWLRRHPLAYLISHNGILPCMVFYGIMASHLSQTNITDLETYLPSDHRFILLVVLSSLHGMVIEIGRKIRAPEQEIIGGETYSQLWGLEKSVLLWLAIAWMGVTVNTIALQPFPLTQIALILLAVIGIALGIVSYRFLQNPSPKGSKLIYTCSAGWVLLSYLSLGLLPWVLP